jgi:hypothetical protein
MTGTDKYGDVKAFQLLWPDMEGHYPNEVAYDHENMPQPIYPTGVSHG